MAAYAALASLLNSIDQIMNHPRLSTSLDNNQIQPLLERAGFLLDFIEGYNYGGVTISKEVEDLERQMASAAHAAEDVIESHIVDQIHAGSTELSRSCSLHLHQITEDMDNILRKANELKEREGLRLREEQPHPRPLMVQTGESGANAMVGFEDELIQLMDELTNQRSTRHVISIVGMGGMGKTTLAKSVYDNLLITQHFDIRAWATVSQQYNAKEILSQFLSGQGNSSHGTVDELGLQLHKTLSGRRYLIILDDIWSVEALDEVSRFFPDNGNRSRVVLTTRLSNVARDGCSNTCFMMKPLDEHINWKLFCKKAFQQENCPYSELERVGKEIARLCRGLPLSTVVIGGFLLNSPRSVAFWKNVLRNIKSNPDSKEKEESLGILSLSYNHLPPHLKPCFLYMGVFTEDSEIRVSKIIKLWIAEGFLRPKNTYMLEEAAECYLQDLIDRNLILVSKHRRNGKLGSCGIHDLVRDLCLKVGEQQEFYHVTKGEIQGTEHRLAGSERPRLLHSGTQLVRSSLARSSTLEQPVNHKLLRVWDEGHLESPSELYGNVNLRYLAYKPFFHPATMLELPSSVSLMWNLQTLIIKYIWAYTAVVAPIEIWKMRQLRHVKFSKIYLPDPPPPSDDGLFMMDNLRTLTTAVNLRLSEEVCKIIPNIKKLHLVYSSDWCKGYDDRLIECLCNLGHLHKLESLNLSVPKLVPERNKMVAFPISLKKLSLDGSLLGWEDLWMIGSLPVLKVLELGISSLAMGKKWSPVNEQFLRLKVLKLQLCGLYYWEADSSHFPVLEKLFLLYLQHLEEIPSGIGEIPTLELIRVDYCSESAAISAVRIKEDQLENDDLQIKVNMPNSKLESFKGRVKEEGLTIHNIQLQMFI